MTDPNPVAQPFAPRLLSHWIHGTARVTFRDGAIVTRRMTQREARDLNAMVSGDRGGDVLTWADLRWLTVEETRVDAVEFDAAPDLGWPLSADARAAQADRGHPHGVLHTIHHAWQDCEEPTFSVGALRLLSALAESHRPAYIAAYSERLVGEDGAALASRILAAADAAAEAAAAAEEVVNQGQPGGDDPGHPGEPGEEGGSSAHDDAP